MSSQMSLDVSTSDASLTVAPVTRFACSHIDLVLKALMIHGPLTPHELSSFLPLDAVQTTKRLSDLERAGKAEPTNESRKTPSGGRARVWKART